MSKKGLPLGFLIQATIGDTILNRTINNLIDEYGNCTPGTKVFMMGELKSNNFIKDWKPILKPKFIDLKPLSQESKIKIQGDIVEASIAFLYQNYGIESAERYIKTNLIKSLKQIV